MSDRHLTIRWLITVVSVLALVGAACGADTQPDRPEHAPTSTASASPTSPGIDLPDRTQFGFGLSPSSYTGTDLPDFLDRIEGNTDVLMHAGDWGELDGTVFDVAATLAEQRGLGFVAVVSPSAAGDLIRPLDGATRERYLASLRTFVAEQRPEFLGLANEVNMLATDDPGGFEETVSLWEEALMVVREESPETVVFVTFQLEWLLGLRGGWFGRQVVEPDWDIIDRFMGADAIGFTTYPSLVFDDPADLPPDYYTQIGERTDLPVIFTEIGWTAFGDLPLLSGSEEEQVKFLDVLADQTQNFSVELLVWTFVRADLVSEQPFRGMDLIRSDGTPRPSWQRWLAMRG